MHQESSGFSLVEVLVATTIVIVALAALLQAVASAASVTTDARAATVAATIAETKLEELQTLSFSVGADGSVLTDTALAASPAGALDTDVGGYCDFFDARGAPIERGGSVAMRAFTRRWSIEPLPADTANAVVLQVVVLRRGGRETRLVSVRARMAF